MSYTPPDALNVILDFEQPATPVDSHNVVLNFADVEPQLGVLEAAIDTRIQVLIQGSNAEIVINHGDLLATINTNIQATISGRNWGNIDNRGALLAVIDTSIQSRISGINDINHTRGIETYWAAEYQTAIPYLTTPEISWSKPTFKAHHSAFFYDSGLTISHSAESNFQAGLALRTAVQKAFEQGTRLSSSGYLYWQENQKSFINQSLVFEESAKLRIQHLTEWDELIRKRKQLTFSHEVAEVFEHRLVFDWDKGLELVTQDSIPWEKARPTYYRKHVIEPWPEPEIPEYVGNTDLVFNCLCTDVDSHNVILNFGVDDCIPTFESKPWLYIVNEISVTRLDNGQNINVLSGNYRTDRQSWCWSYTLVIPAYELSKLDPVAGQPVILKIVVNGFEHLMLLENRTRSRQFAQETYTLTGRSPSALLDSPSSPPRAFLQENERTSVQLVQAEIDRSAYPDLALNWQLIDALGWIVPTESFSYSGLTPIKAIQEIAAAAGGFVYSEANSQAITIKPLYKRTFWDSMRIDDYDILLPESIVTEQSTDYETYPDYNGTSLTNDKTGATGLVKRTGTSGDVLLETVNNNLFTSASVMGAYAKSVLAKAGMVEIHTFTMPLTQEIGLCKPADILAFNAEWWGIVDSISGSFTYSKVTQTVTVERVNHE
ncbi:hypothetical protein [Acinetobacter tandoii]|uniref:Tip attachment protein J domain-containing protein n=1 Tax=Acinetobacter tandoii DSM 14970 = CIP 107469 TaxID=1120927 RepID=R9AV09_9GAMM|nr:hypothetical protein [Acinetobacter tandoii]EOR06028.1 hypothetical protein I593_02846 [Acinetobacter tandoii DSM 14970 = CIP 107469]